MCQTTHWGKRVFSTNGAGTAGHSTRKNKSRSLFYTINKSNRKSETKFKSQNYPIMRKENIEANLCDLGLGNGFLDITSKTQTTKRKVGK